MFIIIKDRDLKDAQKKKNPLILYWQKLHIQYTQMDTIPKIKIRRERGKRVKSIRPVEKSK